MSNMVEGQWLFLKDLSKLISFIEKCNVVVTGGELYRTQYQQDHYIKTGLSKVKHSKHQDRIAIDLNFIDEGEMINCPEDIGKYWTSLSPKNIWGGDWTTFRDYGHFERNI
jgi:hypothetical protein